MGTPTRAPARRGISLIWLLVPLVFLGAAIVLFAMLQRPRSEVAFVPVTLVTANPQTVTRLHGAARLTAPDPVLLSFKVGGRVDLVLPAGKRVEAGEILAKLDSADHVHRELERYRDRESHYRLKLEAAQAGKERGLLRLIERKVEEKQKLVEDALARYAARVVVSPSAGILVAATAQAGETVKPEQTVVRFVPLTLRADFVLKQEAGGSLRAAQTVQLMTETGRTLQSHIESAEPQGAKVRIRVAIDPSAGAKAGDTVQLVRTRFEQVARIPLTAITRQPQGEVVFVVAGEVARARRVTVVDRGPDDALVTQGLRPGEQLVAAGVEALVEGQRVRTLP